jgi:hypothetical protein
MNAKDISIDKLIEIIENGSKIKTGVNVYNSQEILLLDKIALVSKRKMLDILEENGLRTIPFNSFMNGGVWDEDSNSLKIETDGIVE